MAQPYTKNAIREEFIRQLNEKPLSKITVKSIVDECQINRNTFYYHYSDVYAVLEEIFEEELSKGVKEYNDTSSWEEAFLRSSNFAFENRKAINHIYHSIQREQLERYLYSIAGDVMNRYVNRINENIGADKEDVEIIAYFYQCALTQMVLKWIETGIQDNAEELIRKTGKIFDGNIEMMLKKRKSGNS